MTYPSVLVATPCFGGLLYYQYVLSLLATIKLFRQKNITWQVEFIEKESLIPRGRNSHAMTALRNGLDKLLFIDADIVFTPEMVERLLTSPHPIVGGTYPIKAFPVVANFNPLPGKGSELLSANRGIDYDKFDAFKQRYADERGEAEVRHLPTGFLMIDTKVLRDLSSKVPEYTSVCPVSGTRERHFDFFRCGVQPGTHCYESEDWNFSRVAAENGYQVYLNTHCMTQHVGTHAYSMGQLCGEVAAAIPQ